MADNANNPGGSEPQETELTGLSKEIFDVTMDSLRKRKDPDGIINRVKEIVLQNLLRRESDEDVKVLIGQLFVALVRDQKALPEAVQLTWVLIKVEWLLKFALQERERVAALRRKAADDEARATNGSSPTDTVEGTLEKVAAAMNLADATVWSPIDSEALASAESGWVENGGWTDRIPSGRLRGSMIPSATMDAKNGHRITAPEWATETFINIVSPQQLVPTAIDRKNLSKSLRDAICYRLASVLLVFQKTNGDFGRKEGILPFSHSHEFMNRLLEVVDTMVFPAMHIPKDLPKDWDAIAKKSAKWEEVNTENLLNVLSVASKKDLLRRWNVGWDFVTNPPERLIKWKGDVLGNIGGLRTALQSSNYHITRLEESESTEGLPLPQLNGGDIELFRSLISVDADQVKRLEVQWERIKDLYQQEFEPKWNQAKSSEGYVRDVIIQIIKWEMKEGPFSKHLGEFLAIMAYLTLPKFSIQYLKSIMTSLKHESAAPYLYDFLQYRNAL